MLEEVIAMIWALLVQLQRSVVKLLENLLFFRVPHLRQPPGPLTNLLPVFGSLPLFFTDPAHEILTKISTKYDKIYRLILGKTTYIVICDPELLRETFAKEAVSGRNMSLMDVMNQQGLVNADGKFWRIQRAFVHEVLRALGLPRTAELKEFDKKAKDAIETLVKELQDHNGSPISLDEALCIALSNIFFSMIVGIRFGRKDRSWLAIINSSHESFRATEPISLANFVPCFAQLAANKKTVRTIEASKTRFIQYMTPIVQDHRKHLDRANPKDLIDSFLVQMGNGTRFFTETQLYSLLGDLFTSSVESSAATLHWILLALIKYPGIQQKVYEEIKDVTKNEREPTLEDRPRLPYTEATLLEGYRFSSVLPFGVAHATTEDTIIQGYHIPQRAAVIGLFWKINRDPKLWNNPNCFDPNNHFDNSGTFVRRPYLMPFSVGRRNCISETVANDIIYLIIVNLISKFVIQEADGAPAPSMDDSLGGVLRAPLPYKIKMVPRPPTEPAREHHGEPSTSHQEHQGESSHQEQHHGEQSTSHQEHHGEHHEHHEHHGEHHQ